jgi:hypothetical protein
MSTLVLTGQAVVLTVSSKQLYRSVGYSTVKLLTLHSIFTAEVVSIPSQLFAFASDRVLLQNNAVQKCLAADLSLVSCLETGVAASWTFVFQGREDVNRGKLFYMNEADEMNCLTRSPDGSMLHISICDRTNSLQDWDYSSLNGFISVTTNNSAVDCVSAGFSAAEGSYVLALGSCDDAVARWSQYSECRLNVSCLTDVLSRFVLGTSQKLYFS